MFEVQVTELGPIENEDLPGVAPEVVENLRNQVRNLKSRLKRLEEKLSELLKWVPLPKFEYENLRVSPEIVGLGENIRVSVNVKNVGTASGDKIVQLYSDNKFVDSEKVTLAENKSGKASFIITEKEPGTHTVEIGPYTDNFTVKSFRPAWFVDKDDVVGLTDLMTVSYHYGESGTPGWIPADVAGSGSIGLSDLMTVSYHYGEEWG